MQPPGCVTCGSSWNWPEAEQALRTAIELEPSHTRAKCWFAFLRLVQGQFGEACTFAREAQALEPVSPYVSAILVHALMLDGQHTEAVTELERGRTSPPIPCTCSGAAGQPMCGRACPTKRSRCWNARRCWRIAMRLPGWLGWAYTVARRRESAESTLDELDARARTAYVSPVFKAWIVGALGRIDEAFDPLEQGYQERSPLLPWLVYPYDACATMSASTICPGE